MLIAEGVDNNLLHLCGNLTLTERESIGAQLHDSDISTTLTRGKYCLAGNVLSDRNIHRMFSVAP